eukprot:3067965-Pyramimonas_sp.AAC.1
MYLYICSARRPWSGRGVMPRGRRRRCGRSGRPRWPPRGRRAARASSRCVPLSGAVSVGALALGLE